MKRSPHVASRIAATSAALLLVLGVVACAPEPDTEDSVPSEVAGQGGKNTETAPGESSWGQPTDDIDVEQRSTELPATFPKDAFPLPDGAVVYDAGERGDGIWFLVLESAAEADAGVLWDQIVQLGGFTTADEVATPEGGRSAALANATLRVIAVTLPQPDGSIQLSYDISQIS